MRPLASEFEVRNRNEVFDRVYGDEGLWISGRVHADAWAELKAEIQGRLEGVFNGLWAEMHQDDPEEILG